MQRPGLHSSEDSRWDYRDFHHLSHWEGSTHEGDVDGQLFSDREAEAKAEQRRWELTLNHWDLPIHEIDPIRRGSRGRE